MVAKATGSMWSCQLFSVHGGQPTPVPPAVPCPLASLAPPLPCLPPLLSTHGGPLCPVSPMSGVSRCWKLRHHWQSRVPCSRSIRHHSPLSSRDATCRLPPTLSALCHFAPAPPPASPAWPSPALGSQGFIGAACTTMALWAPARPLWSHPTKVDLCPHVLPLMSVRVGPDWREDSESAWLWLTPLLLSSHSSLTV